MICIYHSKDLDGWMSAAIVKLKYPDVKLIGWNYGDPLYFLGNESKDVIMVDVSFPPVTMLDAAKAGNLIWIDHHQRTIEETYKYFSDHNQPLMGRCDPKFAACELAWNYFFEGQKMPELVRLLGRYDCFGHKGTNEELKVLEFQYGARHFITDPDTALIYLRLVLRCDWDAFNTVEAIHSAGKNVYAYLCTEAKQKYAQKFDILLVEDIELPCRKFAAINTERFNPVNFGIDYHKDGYDGVASFYYQDGKWEFSFYNDNGLVDCSAIAKLLGGGGHKGAAGARINNIHDFITIHRYEQKPSS